MDVALSRPETRTRKLSQAWDLLIALTSRELLLRYRGTVLGYVWWILRPLALGVMLWFALSKVLALDIPDYHLFLMTGLFPWFWFASAVSQSADIFVGYSGLVKKVQFPRIVLPLSTALGNAAQFLVTLPVLIIFVVIAGERFEWAWLFGLPLLILLQFALTIGVGLILSSLNVFIRDLSPLVDVSVNLLFYASAVIYPLDRVPDGMRPLLLINPLTALMESWRDVILAGTMPGWEIWPAVGLSVVTIIAGLFIFKSVEKHFADAL